MLPDTTAIVGGFAVAAAVGMGGAALAGTAWSVAKPLRARFGWAEPGLALFGLIGTASVSTAALLTAWGAPLRFDTAPSLDDPLFAASLIGTVSGHLAVLAWAATLRAPLALARVPLRWWLGGILVGIAALFVSGAWIAVEGWLQVPTADQGLVVALIEAPPGWGRSSTLGFVVFGAPILEELVFRGYLQTTLAPRVGPLWAGAASAACFGLFHMADPWVVPVLTIIGALLAWVRARSGSVLPSILGHVVNNGAAIAMALAGASQATP